MKHSLDEFKKLLHKKEQQLKRQDREFRHVMTETIQLAAQVGNVYNLFFYKILINLLKNEGFRYCNTYAVIYNKYILYNDN